MKLLRNREIKRMCLALLAAAAFFSAAGFLLSPAAGALVLFSAAAFGGIGLWYTRRRYEKLAELSRLLDEVLHGGAAGLLSGGEEGELSILRSQIGKLALTLKEQADAVKREKDALSDTLSDISHQLKTPLTSMNLLVLRLRKYELSQEERRACLIDMDRMLLRMEWLIAALLKMSKMDAGAVVFKREKVLVGEMAKAAAEPLLIAMELREQRLELQGDSAASFTGDFGWTAEALGNILKNCMEHTPPGGRILISWEETPIYTEIVTLDSGPGIAAADLPRIFERFYQSAGSEGVGIGLALARMIAAGQNGIVKAENRREGGSRFTLRFYKSVV